MPLETINGWKVHYEIHGSGDTVFLLHNGFSCGQMWEEIYPNLVKEGYRVVIYDRRGYGRSERGPDFEEFYVSDRFCPESVKELAALREILDVDSFHIVGQCEGGVIGAMYTLEYPLQVRSLVTSSTPCYTKMPMTEFTPLKFTKSWETLDQKFKEKIIYWQGGDYAETFYNLFRAAGGAYSQGIFDMRDLLPSLECPSLVIYPDRGFIFDVEQGVSFYRLLRQGELVVLPQCGHNTFEDQPEEYCRSIVNFFKRHQS